MDAALMGSMKRSFPAIVFALGLEGLVAGCCLRDVRVSRSALTAYHEVKQSQLPDPLGNQHLLGPHDFVVPDKVMEVAAAYKGEPKPDGFFVSGESEYSPAFLVEPFIVQLQKAGYTEHDAWLYYGVLNTQGNIVISEQTFQSLHFRKVLAHEQLHRRISNLPCHERAILSDAYQNLHERNIIPPIFFQKTKKAGTNSVLEFYPALTSWTYGLDDPIGIKIEEVLAKDHPQAYQIFERLRNEEKQSVGLME